MKPRAHLIRLLVGLGLVLAVVAAACGDDGDEVPAPSGSATHSQTGLQTSTPEATVAGTEYPLTITDMLGRSVTIEAAPATVAALAPTTVELVYAVGGTSVTRASSVGYPEAAVSATDIGPSYQPN